MGWGDCGTDSKGRPIGYLFEATCDYPGCGKKIDRGLSYACGNMHGETTYGCEQYFCREHLKLRSEDEYYNEDGTPLGDELINICPTCSLEFDLDRQTEGFLTEQQYHEREGQIITDKDVGDLYDLI